MATSNNPLVSVSESLDPQMANLGVTDQQMPTVGHARRVFNVNAGNVLINAGRTLAGTLADDTLKLRISEANKTFIPTESFRHIHWTLDKFGHVTISGASGEGKTTMSLMLARGYIKKGYQIVFVEKIDHFDFNECISSAQRLVLIVDDIFGTVGLSTDTSHLKNLIMSIQTHIQAIKHISGKSQTQAGRQNSQHPTDRDQDQQEEQNLKDIRVVFTSKTYNFKDGISKLQYERLSMFTGHKLIDLTTDKEHRYSDEEKISIFEKHKAVNPKMKTDDIMKQDILNIDTTLFSFPLTCRLFFEFAIFSGSTKDFFKRPLFYLRIELNNLLSLKNDQTAALILMLLCEDKLDLAKLEVKGRDKTMDEMFQHVTEIVPSATRQGTATAARYFRGTFFSGGDTLYFAHSFIYDACSCAMYKFNPAFVLLHCSTGFLYERLKTRSVDEARVSDHLHFLFLSDNYYDLFATRLVEEVVHGRFSKTLTHPMLKNEKFAALLVQKLQGLVSLNTKKYKEAIRCKDKGKGFLYWAVQGFNDNLVFESENIFHVRLTQREIREALDGCVENNNIVFFKFLVSKLEQPIHCSIHQELLLMSGVFGCWEIAQYLLIEGTDVQATDKHRHNFIHLACKFGRAGMLKSFIGQLGSLMTRKNYLSVITSLDIDGRTPALLAAVCGSWDCFTLLSRDSNLDIRDIYRDEVIHWAAWHGNRDIVQQVLTPSNINSRGQHGCTPVMKAVVSGHPIVLELLISNNADLTLVDDYGDSVLHLACEGGDRDIVPHVLTLCNINGWGRHGLTPVMMAAVHGYLSVFKLLVSNNAVLKLVDDYGNSVLHLACEGGNRDIVQDVLTPSNINCRGRHGWTPVMKAAVSGHLSVFKLLVSNNADLTLVDNSGDSVLHLASQGGNRDIVQHALTPININSRGKHGWTPVMTAAVGGHHSVFELLVSNNAVLIPVDDYGDSVLHLACQGGNRDIVKHVMTLSNINSRGEHGFTPVMMAAVHGHLRVFRLLISNNADLTLVDDYGDSVLHLACQGGNRAIVQQALTPSNINSRGRHDWTPVMIVAVHGYLSVFELLVSNTADLTLVDNYNDSVLHLACMGGNRDIVQHVLTRSNINSRGRHGWTPVMKAAVHDHLSVFELLVSNNADITMLDKYRNSVLHLAFERGNIDIVQHVLAPSNINSRGRHGWTPVMKAAVSGHLNVFKLLVSNNAALTLVNDYGNSVLHLACQGGNRDIVQQVLTPSNINSRGRHGLTPIMIAAVHDHLCVFELLVSNNADLTLVDDRGFSVLHLAFDGRKKDIKQHVLAPSNINRRGRHGWTPVMMAAVHGHLSVFKLLVSNNADLTLVDDCGNSVLHMACQGGNGDIVQHVLAPSNINSRGEYGLTPAMTAAVRGHHSVFELLVSNNAILVPVDDYGDSVLHLACQGGNRDIVQQVLTPSNINSRGQHSWTPVMMAAVHGHLSVFELLVSNNAGLTLVDEYGDSVLHVACHGGNEDIVQQALTPSNINSRGRHGWTPVMKAAVNGHLSVFELLVTNNADLTLMDDHGDSVLQVACRGGNRDIVQHVLTLANCNSRGNYNRTPLMVAAYYSHTKIIDLLIENGADLLLKDSENRDVVQYAMEGGHSSLTEHIKTRIQENDH